MDWSDEPATWKQVKFLKEHGYTPDRRLTKSEAADMIRKLEGHLRPGAATATASYQPRAPQASPPTAYQLRVRADKARCALVDAGRSMPEKLQHELADALSERQCFWI